MEVVRRLRSDHNNVPVLMLTARDEDIDKILGLELGADDYMTKPFSPRELVARVRTVLRRSQGSMQYPNVLRAADLDIYLDSRRVNRSGASVELSRIEFNLLEILAQHPGQTFSRDQLLDRLHGIAFEGFERSIDAHVKNLRRKLEPDPRQPRYVLTVYGVGYKFNDEL
jgi:DNA-binding response OmpR family regulator